MSRYLTVAKRAARRAGSTLVLRHATFRRSTAHYKERNELVTTEDARSERNILSELRQNFPDHTFISEEAGLRQGSGDYVWYVDPLDGTSNYVMGNPLYGISIALAHRKELILGVLYFPEIKRMFWAEQGGGA
jgi:myo-inositol-1(or 4)-monophosphatase